jgi:hypothetical protein
LSSVLRIFFTQTASICIDAHRASSATIHMTVDNMTPCFALAWHCLSALPVKDALDSPPHHGRALQLCCDPRRALFLAMPGGAKSPRLSTRALALISLTMSYFHTGTRTIIGAESFHCPVRDGKEWDQLAMVIRLNRWLGCCFKSATRQCWCQPWHEMALMPGHKRICRVASSSFCSA